MRPSWQAWVCFSSRRWSDGGSFRLCRRIGHLHRELLGPNAICSAAALRESHRRLRFSLSRTEHAGRADRDPCTNYPQPPSGGSWPASGSRGRLSVREIAKGSRDRRRTEAQRGPESAQEPSIGVGRGSRPARWRDDPDEALCRSSRARPSANCGMRG